jgi:hypothetical protein
LIVLQQLRRLLAARQHLPDDLGDAAFREWTLGGGADRANNVARHGTRCLWRHDLERWVADGRAEEAAVVIRHFEEPTRPTARTAAELGVGQIAHDRQRLRAGG